VYVGVDELLGGAVVLWLGVVVVAGGGVVAWHGLASFSTPHVELQKEVMHQPVPSVSL